MALGRPAQELHEPHCHRHPLRHVQPIGWRRRLATTRHAMTGLQDNPWVWDLLLRGAVAGVLLFHLIHLALPGPRAAARVALAVFTLSLIAYLFCQRAELTFLLPRPLALVVLALCVSSTAWLWLAARSLFDDHFALTPPLVGTALGLVVIGLAGNVPRLDAALVGRTVHEVAATQLRALVDQREHHVQRLPSHGVVARRDRKSRGLHQQPVQAGDRDPCFGCCSARGGKLRAAEAMRLVGERVRGDLQAVVPQLGGVLALLRECHGSDDFVAEGNAHVRASFRAGKKRAGTWRRRPLEDTRQSARQEETSVRPERRLQRLLRPRRRTAVEPAGDHEEGIGEGFRSGKVLQRGGAFGRQHVHLVDLLAQVSGLVHDRP